MVISYIFAGLATLAAAACYGELSVEFPILGGAFSYTMLRGGEGSASAGVRGPRASLPAHSRPG